MRRLIWPVLVTLALIVAELALARALAAGEPLRAILTGKLWVGGLAVVALATRLALVLLAPGWVLAACVEAWLERGRGD